MILCFIFSSCFIFALVEGDFVTIEQGTLEGTTRVSRNGRVFKAYYKIPFAKPPVGPLRFRAPQYPDPWDGILNATVPSTIDDGCIQIPENDDNIVGKEDCLTLDLYVPLNATRRSKLPVISHIFGGDFQVGYPGRDGPEYLLDRDVIVVQAGYRLGVLGMLSTGDLLVSGNMALKDQTMVLRWVKNNIYHFGGDPERVTILGHSSGASCVGLHNYSPLSKGLFQRAIMMSGSAFGWDAIRTQSSAKKVSIEIAQNSGCPEYETSQQILDCISTLDMKTILNTTFRMSILGKSVMPTWIVPFVPVIEDPNAEDPFLLKVPLKSEPQSTEVSWLIGLTTGEWAIKAGYYLEGTGERAKLIDQNHLLYFPVIGVYIWNSKPNSLDFISQALRTYYFGDEEISRKTDVKLTEMLTNSIIAYPMLRSIKQFDGIKYVYLYGYKSNYTYMFNVTSYEKYLGPVHTDDLVLVFNRTECDKVLTAEDVTIGDEMIKRFVNFANSGNPNFPITINEAMFQSWSPSVHKEIDYLIFDINGTMKTGLKTEHYQFFQSLPMFNNV